MYHVDVTILNWSTSGAGSTRPECAPTERRWVTARWSAGVEDRRRTEVHTKRLPGPQVPGRRGNMRRQKQFMGVSSLTAAYT